MLGEDDRAHVGLFDHAVDDDEGGVGVVGCDNRQRRGLAEARHDDRVGTRLGQAAHGLLALGVGLQFDLAVGAAGGLGPALAPLKAASLKERSNLPPRSKMIAGPSASAPTADTASAAVAPIRVFISFIGLSPGWTGPRAPTHSGRGCRVELRSLLIPGQIRAKPCGGVNRILHLQGPPAACPYVKPRAGNAPPLRSGPLCRSNRPSNKRRPSCHLHACSKPGGRPRRKSPCG
jgi:hypothetical protein